MTLHEPMQAHKVLTTQIWPHVKNCLMAGQKVRITIDKETRSIEQNSRLWSMLTDVSKQVDWYGRKLSPEDWKHIFTASLKKQDAVVGIDGGIVVLGLSTRKMSKATMSQLQELIEAFGAERGVMFRAVENV